MTTLAVIAIVAGFVALLVVTILWARRREQDRAEAVRIRGTSLGFSYEEKSDAPATGGEALALFQRGRKKRAQHVMRRTDRDIETVLFDYSYTVGSGKHQSTHRQTVALFRFPDGDLPKFEVSPENVFHRLAGVFGYQDIDFDASPEFSKAYLVRGADEARVRSVIGPSARHMLERSAGWSVDGGGRVLAVYRSSKRVDPDELGTFVEDAREIRRAVAGR